MDFAASFGLTMELLRQAIAAKASRNRALAPLLNLVWARLARMSQRFDALVARFRAGTLPASRSRAPRPSRSAPQHRLPRGFAWLIRLAPEVAVFGSQLQHLLGDPQMAEFLKAAPQAGRILRPLCTMLAVTTAPPKPPPRNPPPANTSPPSHAPLPDRPGQTHPDPAISVAEVGSARLRTTFSLRYRHYMAMLSYITILWSCWTKWPWTRMPMAPSTSRLAVFVSRATATTRASPARSWA